jgi:hypothetical protein
MTQTHCQERARRLLTAWTNGGMPAGMENRRVNGADAGEQEREELLEGIREGLTAGGARGAVSLRLLRHLALRN